jgi:RNA polymerase sigma-70 factor (ECF subfamily)
LGGAATTRELDEKTLEAAREGDRASRALIYTSLSGPVYSYLLRLTGNPEEASDLTSETFLQVLRDLGRFRGSLTGFRAWVFRIARNRAMDRFRHLRRSPEEPWGEPAEERQVLNPEALALENIEREELLRALEGLTQAQREVLLLRFLGGLSVAEVAETLETTPGAVKLLQHRALRSLARRLAGRGGLEGGNRQGA